MRNEKYTKTVMRLSSLVEQLLNEAIQTDRVNSGLKSHKLIENNNLFSVPLFSTQSDQISHYVKEIKVQLDSFTRLYAASSNNDNKKEFAKSALLNIEQQISAVFNVLQANQSMHESAQSRYDLAKNNRIRTNKERQRKQYEKYKQSAKEVLVSSHDLYQKLSEHHEFERRLIDMITEREQQRTRSKTTNSDVSAEVLALHQRLGRCRKAISIIERDIERSEKVR